MKFTVFLTRYFFWHYGSGLKSFFVTWGNFLWFGYNFFSIPLLLGTLFAPFQREKEEYKKGLDLGAIGSALLVNLIMRCLGAGVRLVLIGMGIVSLLLILVSGVAFLALWLLLPLISVTLTLLALKGMLEF